MADNAEHPIIADRFVLEEQVGVGGMGVVWRAQDTLLGRTVALKELRLPHVLIQNTGQDDLERRALREARAAARLNHPAAVTVYDAVRESGKVFVVMEYVDAPTLQQLIDQHGALDVARVARIGIKVAEVLEYAHQRGLVHRDVKPANLMVLPGDQIKVADFGITRIADEPAITRQGILFGSPSYMAPEQLADADGGTDPTVDWWSLGATLYHAVEGRPPFPGNSAPAVIVAVATQAPAPPLLAGPVLGDVLLKLLDKEPGRRPEAMALQAALAAVDHSGTTTTGMFVVRHEIPGSDRQSANTSNPLSSTGWRPAERDETLGPVVASEKQPTEELNQPGVPEITTDQDERSSPLSSVLGRGTRYRRRIILSAVAVVIGTIVAVSIPIYINLTKNNVRAARSASAVVGAALVDEISGANKTAMTNQYGSFEDVTLHRGDAIHAGVRIYLSGDDNDVKITLSPAQSSPASSAVPQGTLEVLDVSCGSVLVTASVASNNPSEVVIPPGNDPLEIDKVALPIPPGASLSMEIKLLHGCSIASSMAVLEWDDLGFA